jgi:hypothetical protein
VAEIAEYSLNWLYELGWGYNPWVQQVFDKRQNNAGRTPLLNDQQQALLWQALQEPPSDGEL